MTAIGTLVAVVVALVLGFFPAIRRWWDRPKFGVDYENVEPFCRHTLVYSITAAAGLGLTTVPAFWIRLRVKNVGRSVARSCEGKLLRIIELPSMKERTDFDPTILQWVGTKRNPIDISKGEYEYLDVVHTISDRPSLLFVTAREEEPRGINLSPPLKDYIIHIALYGANVQPLLRIYKLRSGAGYDKITLEPLPDC
jgi:hypothetical protein